MTLLTEKQQRAFWAKVQVVASLDDCWLWHGALDSTNYGVFRVGKKLEMAHRIAYMMKSGAIEFGLVVMHTCDNSRCVRPSHLRLGTQAENIYDAIEKGRAPQLRVVPESPAKTS